jgi:hypothetical protein
MTATDLPPAIEEALKAALSALHEADVDCMIGGGLAAWAQGGPPSTRDVDLMVRAGDAQAASEALAGAGMKTEEPPEDWLVKAYHDGVLIDLIHGPVGVPVDDELFSRAVNLDVCAMRARVMALEDLFTTTLLALNDNALDYGPALKMARSVREKVDWAAVQDRTAESPYARGFFALAAELGLSEVEGAR